jgi:hypothetical protein
MAVHLGLLLVAHSGLAFEIGPARSCSVTISCSFAFAAFSVALLAGACEASSSTSSATASA